MYSCCLLLTFVVFLTHLNHFVSGRADLFGSSQYFFQINFNEKLFFILLFDILFNIYSPILLFRYPFEHTCFKKIVLSCSKLFPPRNMELNTSHLFSNLILFVFRYQNNSESGNEMGALVVLQRYRWNLLHCRTVSR